MLPRSKAKVKYGYLEMREFKNKIDFKLSLSKNYIFVQGWWNFVCFWTGYKIINFLFWGEIGIEQSRIRIVGGGGVENRDVFQY